MAEQYLVSLIFILILGNSYCDYWSDRAAILAKESSNGVGFSVQFSAKEQQVNEILMELKLAEWDAGFENQTGFPPAVHFFHSKTDIEKSEVFNFIKKLPKGASLHSHTSAMNSFEYTYNLTFRENLYGCILDDVLQLNFFENSSTVDDSCSWKLLRDWRNEDPNFDDYLKAQLTIVVDNPETAYKSIDEVWTKFQKIFTTLGGLLNYRPVFEDYFYETLQEFFDDNIIYLEMRGGVGGTYDLDGTAYSDEENANQYINVLSQFKQANPDFYDARLIYAKNRQRDNATVVGYLENFLRLNNLFPNFVVAFDLVGQEDLGNPLVEYVDILLQYADRVKYIFHAGETNWNGGPTDTNIIDAILLNTTRIGHAYAILKHTEALRLVKERQIGIELNPVSNQVLKLVDDLRDHTGAHLIASGYPVVITCDDPGLWGAKGLSYDWYMAFMGLASREADLRTLKQLALNSILFSSMRLEEQAIVVAKWQVLWDKFLDNILQGSKYHSI